MDDLEEYMGMKYDGTLIDFVLEEGVCLKPIPFLNDGEMDLRTGYAIVLERFVKEDQIYIKICTDFGNVIVGTEKQIKETYLAFRRVGLKERFEEQISLLNIAFQDIT